MKTKKELHRYLIILGLLLMSTTSWSKVTLPTLLSDGMVMQRNVPLKIWGTADANEVVEISFTKDTTPVLQAGQKLKKNFSTTADKNGEWMITLPALKAGGPYKIQINDITLSDIYIGDVFLCSGQSNMELPVARVAEAFQEEVATYNNSQIRCITIPKEFNFNEPQDNISPASWKELNQENVMRFSAIAYFFAKELINSTNVPVGLINASWGGTPVEAWTSEQALQPFPRYINDKRQYEDANYRKQIKDVEAANFSHWNASLYKGDAGLQEDTVWYANNYDDSNWQEVELLQSNWATNGMNPINGSHWFRKEITIPENWEGKDATLRLGCIVDADSVFVNGVFVGTTGYQYPPRIYKVPANILHTGKNNITIRLISNQGKPHFVPEKPYKLICGNEEIGLEGKWKHRLGAQMPSAPGMMFFCYKPVCLYNAMIAPLRNYALDGVIWYQGESNVSRRNEYTELLSTMIADWRKTFNYPTLPFYIVELADFLHQTDKGGRAAWDEMRKEQAKVAEINSDTYLITNSDTGEWNDIHPLDKKTPGQRVARKVTERK